MSVFPMKRIVFTPPRGIDAAIFTNFVYRGAFLRKLTPLIPKSVDDDAGIDANSELLDGPWWPTSNASYLISVFDHYLGDDKKRAQVRSAIGVLA